MNLDEIRALPPELRDIILENQVCISQIEDALNMAGAVLKGIIEANMVEEVTAEMMTDAELSIGPAKEALECLKKLAGIEARAVGLATKVAIYRDALDDLNMHGTPVVDGWISVPICEWGQVFKRIGWDA